MGAIRRKLSCGGTFLAIALSIPIGPVSAAWATDPAPGVIHACVHQDRRDKEVHGAILIGPPNQRCRHGWARVVWNAQGATALAPAGGASVDTARVEALEQAVRDLQAQVQTLQGLLALAPYVQVVPGVVDGLAGPHVIIEGANVHVCSGSGATNDGGTPRGLGNLVVGYNEPAIAPEAGYRRGSHNLVAGGEFNGAEGFASTVAGGNSNVAGGDYASAGGGFNNMAAGEFSTVGGGSGRTAPGLPNWTAGSLFETW